MSRAGGAPLEGLDRRRALNMESKRRGRRAGGVAGASCWARTTHERHHETRGPTERPAVARLPSLTAGRPFRLCHELLGAGQDVPCQYIEEAGKTAVLLCAYRRGSLAIHASPTVAFAAAGCRAEASSVWLDAAQHDRSACIPLRTCSRILAAPTAADTLCLGPMMHPAHPYRAADVYCCAPRAGRPWARGHERRQAPAAGPV